MTTGGGSHIETVSPGETGSTQATTSLPGPSSGVAVGGGGGSGPAMTTGATGSTGSTGTYGADGSTGSNESTQPQVNPVATIQRSGKNHHVLKTINHHVTIGHAHPGRKRR